MQKNILRRRHDWRQAMQHALKARMHSPFRYGEFDCCLAAADVIAAMTDVDPMADFRGGYKSAASAAGLLRDKGKGTLLKTLISVMPAAGSRRIPVARASIGDLMVTKHAIHDACRGQACGICIGSFSLYPGETGWTSLPTTAAHAAFRI